MSLFANLLWLLLVLVRMGFYVALYAYWTEQGKICSEYSLANSCLQWMALYVVITCLSDGDAEIARPDNTRLDNAAQGSGVREQSSAGRLIAAE